MQLLGIPARHMGPLPGWVCGPGAAAGTLGAVSSASARGEVSAAYMILSPAFGNGGSLVALWCVSVSKSEALCLWCFFELE